MAATIAECIGKDSTRTKLAHRLGSKSATARASTFHTFSTAHVNADGSGFIQVKRGAAQIHIEFNPEDDLGHTPLEITYNSLASEPWNPTQA